MCIILQKNAKSLNSIGFWHVTLKRKHFFCELLSHFLKVSFITQDFLEIDSSYKCITYMKLYTDNILNSSFMVLKITEVVCVIFDRYKNTDCPISIIPFYRCNPH